MKQISFKLYDYLTVQYIEFILSQYIFVVKRAGLKSQLNTTPLNHLLVNYMHHYK
jgi:hypothetical protein